jgi:hypothetical protein
MVAEALLGHGLNPEEEASMAQTRKTTTRQRHETAGQRPSKRDQILALRAAGITDVGDLAVITSSRPSYVASVLHGSRLTPGYFDVYTSTASPMNVYSKFFANKLGFKDVETAGHSVELIDHYYRQFEMAGDRAGQHHALLMALTMFDRARWINKRAEAQVYGDWLSARLNQNSGGDVPAAQG